eukprot:m.211048 g.211048  ORF g.211048 m.211048 type:complete len:477 (-) comp33101_c0_seq1:152-1582(-)
MNVNDVASTSPFELSELHFAELEGPTNIYGITTIEQVIDIRPATCPSSSLLPKPKDLQSAQPRANDDTTNGLMKPMIFAISGKGADNEHARNAVVHLQASNSNRGEVFSRKPVLLSDMPPDFNLISVAALRTNTTQEPSILLALSATVKPQTLPPTAEDTFIMIYKITTVSGSTIVPDRFRRMCLTFIPFSLNTLVWNDSDGKENQGFVVSGQNRLLYYTLDDIEDLAKPVAVRPHAEQADLPLDLATLLPEIISPFLSCVTAFVIRYVGETRVSVFACQDGHCHLTTVVEGIVRTSEFVKLDGPISSVDLFETKRKDLTFVHLLVGCAVEAAIVYSDVIGHGLNHAQLLPGSQDFDSVLCVKAIHVNFAPHLELFVGTYGQKLLVYQLDPTASDESCQFPVYRVKSQQSFAHPVYRVLSYDLMDDGINELVVLSMLGLHVFQRDSHKVTENISHLALQMQRLFALQRQLETTKTS